MTDYIVRAMPWGKGWELHVNGIGVTQTHEDDDATAEEMVRDLIRSVANAEPGQITIKYQRNPSISTDQQRIAALLGDEYVDHFDEFFQRLVVVGMEYRNAAKRKPRDWAVDRANDKIQLAILALLNLVDD